MATLLELADRHAGWPMPGYTHLQRALPVFLGGPSPRVRSGCSRARPRALALGRRRRRLPLGSAARTGRELRRRLPAGRRRARLRAASREPGDAVSTRDMGARLPRRRRHLRAHLRALAPSSRSSPPPSSPSSRSPRERVRLLDHAAQEEPRRRRAAAREGPARRGAPRSALHGVLHALPLTYNKDMQEDKEHLFDSVDTIELCSAGRCTRHARGGALPPRPARRSGCGRADRCDRRRRSARTARPAVPRRARRSSPASCGNRSRRHHPLSSSFHPRSAGGPQASTWTTSTSRCWSRAAWLESKVSEGGTSSPRLR